MKIKRPCVEVLRTVSELNDFVQLVKKTTNCDYVEFIHSIQLSIRFSISVSALNWLLHRGKELITQNGYLLRWHFHSTYIAVRLRLPRSCLRVLMISAFKAEQTREIYPLVVEQDEKIWLPLANYRAITSAWFPGRTTSQVPGETSR